ncbi:MAG: hypothetical protein V7708_18395 [Oceanicoccus sp.]
MQDIPLATTLTSTDKPHKPATATDRNSALNSTQRFKQDLIKANQSAADTNAEIKHTETPDTLPTAPTNPTVTAYPPLISQPQVQTPNTTISAKSKQKEKEKEK